MENRFAVRLKLAFSLFQPVSLERFLFCNNFQFLSNQNGLNVFEFTNFPFETKYNNTAVYSVNSKHFVSREKKTRKKIVKKFL